MLEALAARVPVVATEAGGVNEMVISGQTGWLVPNRNPAALAAAMLDALANPDQAKIFALNGCAHVEANFTVERMVAGNLAVYEELTSA